MALRVSLIVVSTGHQRRPCLRVGDLREYLGACINVNTYLGSQQRPAYDIGGLEAAVEGPTDTWELLKTESRLPKTPIQKPASST